MKISDFSIKPISMVNHKEQQRIQFECHSDTTAHTMLRIWAETELLYEYDVAVSCGKNTKYLLIPAPVKDIDTVWQLFSKKDSSKLVECKVSWKAPREITLYMMISSHTDIGLHNSQFIQRYNSEKFIDMAAKLCDETEDLPENDQYRYTIEGTWFWENYPKDRGKSAAERIVTEYINKDKIGICAGIAGNHTQSYGFEEMCRSTYGRHKLYQDWGIESKTMSMVDNNGLSWGMVQPYANAGYQNIIFSPNQWNPIPSKTWQCHKEVSGYQVNPEAGGGGSRIDVRMDSELPMVFWWQAADESSKMLVWASFKYSTTDFVLGFSGYAQATEDTFIKTETGLTDFIYKMEQKYPYDIWLSCCYYDDQEPSKDLTDLFRRWNSTWKWPQIRTLGNPDYVFNHLREKYGEVIPTLRGDITGGWYQHPVAAADLLGRKLNADRILASAEKISCIACLCNSEYTYPSEKFAHAWEALLLHDEHSYGTSNYKGRSVYETWMQHRMWITEAENAGNSELKTAAKAIANSIQTHQNGFCVLNPSGKPRKERISNETGTFVADIPAFGYTTVFESSFKDAEQKTYVTKEPPIIENKWYKICFASNGAMISIFDKELSRELVSKDCGGANLFMYTQNNHKTFISPENALFNVSQTKDVITVTIQLEESVSGAAIIQKISIDNEYKQINIDNTLKHIRDMVNDDRYNRYLYYAFPFFVPKAKRICQLNGCEAEYAKDLTGHGTDVYMQTHEWSCAENEEFGIGLIQRDTALTEFDHIHPDKTDCGDAGEGSEMFSYVANDWLQKHLIGGSHFNLHLRYAITSYSGNHITAKLSERAENFCNPIIVEKLNQNSEGFLPLSQSFLSVSENARLVGLKLAENRNGMIAHLLGDKNAHVTMADAAISRVTIDERVPDNYENDYELGYSAFRIIPEYSEISKRLPEENNESPAPIGSIHTGLITAPCAAPGEEEDTLYLLWGKNMEEDFSHYELYRSEQKGFEPSEETLIALIKRNDYRVEQYEDNCLKTYTKYYYRLRAVNNKGETGSFCEEFSGVTREPIMIT